MQHFHLKEEEGPRFLILLLFPFHVFYFLVYMLVFLVVLLNTGFISFCFIYTLVIQKVRNN